VELDEPVLRAPDRQRQVARLRHRRLDDVAGVLDDERLNGRKIERSRGER
jgi:hypothetical protein